jgi:hypothetical protein
VLVEDAITLLGGRASLSVIYEAIEPKRPTETAFGGRRFASSSNILHPYRARGLSVVNPFQISDNSVPALAHIKAITAVPVDNDSRLLLQMKAGNPAADFFSLAFCAESSFFSPI